jgi:two-component system OmpR family response regulator
VLARLRAVLRRASLASRRPLRLAEETADARVIEGGWRLSAHRRAVVAPDGGAALPLTGAEFELLRLLAGAQGEPVDRETISRSVFRRPWQIEDRAVDGLVKRLRRKLRADAIASVRGVGYALRFAEATAAAESGVFVPVDTTMTSASHHQVENCVSTTTVTTVGMQSAVGD